ELTVEVQYLRVVAVYGDLVRRAIVEPHRLDHDVGVRASRRANQPAQVTELHVVRAGDIRHGSPPGHRPDLTSVERGGGPVVQILDRAQARYDGVLVRYPNHRRIVGTVRPAPGRPSTAVPGHVRPKTRLHQKPARDRRRVRGLLDAGRRELTETRRFGRRCRSAAAYTDEA